MEKIRKLSIVIPVFNEESTIKIIIDKVKNIDLGKVEKEIIVVNDGSVDSTINILKMFNGIKVINHKQNKGKSYALRTGFKHVTGDVVVVQDGDMEYEPSDFVKMLNKMSESGVRVVYGSRRIEKSNKQYSGLSFYWGGLILTYMANFLYGGHITDEPTCYKMFETSLLKSIKLNAKKFEFCPEITAKVLRRGEKIYEVPILYNPRHVDQGKKIKLSDFFEAVLTLVRYRFIE